MKTLLIALLSLVVSACAVQPHPSELASNDTADGAVPVATNGESKVVCRMEKPTGSNRPVRVCRTKTDDVDREETLRDMRIIQQQSEIIMRNPQ